MNTITIDPKSESSSYKVVVGKNLLSTIHDLIDLKSYSKILIVTDTNLESHNWLKKILIELGSLPIYSIVIPAGENHKNLESLSLIWQKLTNNKFDRKSLIINMGGGVIGDMGGMAAASYQRGIDFVQIPTTLLSMVDASVGGKLAIDFGGLKNNLGFFKQPKMVIADIDFLTTLPNREFLSGFAEIIKHGLIHSKEHFEELQTSGGAISKPIEDSADTIDKYSSSSIQSLAIQSIEYKKPSDLQDQELIDLILHSINVKADIVTEDPQEKGIRKVLNFGHTLGHAFETISLNSTTPILHGEAISLGIICEAYLSYLIGLISIIEFGEIHETIKELQLLHSLSDFEWANNQFFNDKVKNIIQGDKKSEFGKIKWSLLEGIGKGVCDIEISEYELVQEAVDFLKGD
jgi:3-dehydroquinate synthase